jgi:hypothetical protein
MRIINTTKDTLLAEDAQVADTFFKKASGLLGKKEFSKGQALILRRCNCIHTFFMRFPIDVVFVDKNNRIIKTLANFKPFRISGIYFRANLVIELPYGTLGASATSVADILSIS